MSEKEMPEVNPLTKKSAAFNQWQFNARRAIKKIHRSAMRLTGRKIQVWKRSESDQPFKALTDKLGIMQAGQYTEDVQAVLSIADSTLANLKGIEQDTFLRSMPSRADAGFMMKRLTSPPATQALLYELVRMNRPAWCVELGSAFGVTSMAIATAQRRNGGGRFDGIEYEKWKAKIANQHLEELGVADLAEVHTGDIEHILPSLIQERSNSIDMGFVDALHTYDDNFIYHQLVSKAVSEGAVVVYDDIDFSKETERFWSDLMKEPNIRDAILMDLRWGIVRYSVAGNTARNTE